MDELRRKDLHELVERLRQAAGSNLKCALLYGSASSSEFQPGHSDLNVFCVLARVEAAELEKLHPAAEWWTRKGHPVPMVFSLEELHRAADVFAVELLDMQARREVLYGDDVIAQLTIPMSLHGQQVERELRTNLLRLRQAFLVAPRHLKTLLELMTASVSTFAALFRHALVVLGEAAPESKRSAVDRLAVRLGFDTAAFHALLDVRDGKRREHQIDVPATFAAYLSAVTRVTEEMDRRLEGN